MTDTTDLGDLGDTTDLGAGTWEELVAVGLLGTERRPLPSRVGDAVAAVLGGDPADRSDGAPAGEVGVLTAAGVLSTYRRTGATTSRRTSTEPTRAGDDRRPLAPEGATRLLDLLLAGHVSVLGPPTHLIGLWLERCAVSGYRLPPGRLVDLLGSATNRSELRGPVSAVAGPLGVWLGEQNPAWSWVANASEDDQLVDVDVDVDQLWKTGGRDVRFALLARVRHRDPAAGLALVESTWSSEKAADRASIIETLAPSASMIDEPFLEAALDDRGKTVRERAAALLQTMPESRLAQRAAARLLPLLPEPKGLLRKKIEVALPSDLDPKLLARDGFDERMRPAKVGVHAWELTQLTTIAPLRTWTDRFSLDPAGIVSATSGSESFAALVQGWTRAVHRQRAVADRRAWALALIDMPGADPHLFAQLPPETAQREAAERLRSWPEAQLVALASTLPGPWSADLTKRVIERLAALKNQRHAALQPLALHAPPESIPDLQAWAARLVADDDAHLRHTVNQVVSTISFRQSILQELP